MAQAILFQISGSHAGVAQGYIDKQKELVVERHAIHFRVVEQDNESIGSAAYHRRLITQNPGYSGIKSVF
jgi:hypothetical protein